MDKLRIVSATRKEPRAFTETALLGHSIKMLSWNRRMIVNVTCNNDRGLPNIYNRAIRESGDDEALLLVHDDVLIQDYYLYTRVREGLETFDVVGVAGNVSPEAGQPTWTHVRGPDGSLKLCERGVLSGIVGHLIGGKKGLAFYGPVPRQCGLLDGCFLAVRAKVLREKRIFFDEQFMFHFYDLDFCRSCTASGLRLGTWPVAIYHGSRGNFETPEWKAGWELYRRKWGDAALPAAGEPDKNSPD